MRYDLQEDTIAAIVTSSTNSGVSIIRVSGPDALEKVSPLIQSKTPTNLWKSHSIHYGYIVDNHKNPVDEVLILYMKGPKSYTREDVVEIHCHGGMVCCREILKIIFKQNIRPAEPGEFTKRAFLNGRIDLTQAEAVMDLISAKNQYARMSGVTRLKGRMKDKVREIDHRILDDVAFIEAGLDDPEHIDMSEFSQEFPSHLSDYMEQIQQMLDHYEEGRLIKEGIQTVILGRPNVGKSSFLNQLLGEDRAIVTDVPGTTRDMIEEDVMIQDVCLHIIDTAGIHETEDQVEKIGIERAKKSMEEADLCLLILDQSSPLTKEDLDLMDLIRDKKSLVLLNKNDLDAKMTMEEIQKYWSSDILSVSSRTGLGVEAFGTHIRKMFHLDQLSFNEEIFIGNERQKTCLNEALEALSLVEEGIKNGVGEDFLSIDLINAHENLKKLMGEQVDDELIETIFSKFCMGK